MKIAFDNTLPDRGKVAALIQACGLEQTWDAGRFFDTNPDLCRFVSAYDSEELVGIGRMVHDADDGGNGRLDIVVLPDYRRRDIVDTIFKLLKTRRSAIARQV